MVRDVVSLDQGEVGGHGDVGVGMQGVADLAQPQVSHLEDAVDRGDRGPGFVGFTSLAVVVGALRATPSRAELCQLPARAGLRPHPISAVP